MLSIPKLYPYQPQWPKKWLQGVDAHKDVLAQLTARMKTLAEGTHGRVSGSTPLSLICPVTLEAAFVTAATETHVAGNDYNEEFHLLFHGPGKDYLDVAYIYNKRAALVLTAIKKLPAGWSVGFMAGEANANKFVITPSDDKPGCIYEFDSSDPFASKAIASQYLGSETSEEGAFAILDTFVEAGANLVGTMMRMLAASRNRSLGAGWPDGLVMSLIVLSSPSRAALVVVTSMRSDCRGVISIVR